jgi:hypothetical protein
VVLERLGGTAYPGALGDSYSIYLLMFFIGPFDDPETVLIQFQGEE